MHTNARSVADKLWKDLVRACQEFGYVSADGSGASPEYNRLVFNEKYHLLTFEVGHGRVLHLPAGSFARSQDLDRLRHYFKNVRLDIVDLGPNLYFNFWINSLGQL